MGARSDLTTEQWAQVREAAILGVGYPELAERFGIEQNAIKQMAWAKDWPTPKRIEAQRQAMLAKQTSPVGNGENLTKANQGSKTIEIVAASDESYVLRTKRAILKGIVPQIEGAMEDAVSFRARSNKDLAAQVGMVWKVTGQDKPTIQAQVNVWSGAGSGQWQDGSQDVGVTVETEGQIDGESVANDE